MIRFGPAGIPVGCIEGTRGKCGTADGISYCRKAGLGAMEVEFVRGVHLKEEKAREAGGVGKGNDVSLSCHAPYYINCCAKEEQKIGASIRHIVASAEAAYWLSASPVVFHPGYYMGRPASECRKIMLDTIGKCFEKMEEKKIAGVRLGAELTGKKSAYGSLEEIIDLAAHFGLGKIMPVVDFAHYHARMKRLEEKNDYLEILEKIEKALGSDAGKNFHCHFSGIEFTGKGERKHLPISSDFPPVLPFLEALKENGWSGTVICESPLMEEDTLVLKEEWGKLLH